MHGAPNLSQAKGKALTRKGKRLFHPIRVALTGSMSGPDIGEQLGLLEAGELLSGWGREIVQHFFFTGVAMSRVRSSQHLSWQMFRGLPRAC